jgi:hypothetical protein
MKISLYIVTYRNDLLLERCIKSINECVIPENIDISINVINNYDRITLDESCIPNVRIYNNDTRPNFSTGHLARNWNQALILGFEDVDCPKSDIVVLLQNDTVLQKDFFVNLMTILPEYDYIAMGKGDEVQIFNIEAVKTIGLYDERYCNIGYQEADYFLRARILHPTKSSINDTYHGRVWNAIEGIYDKYLVNVENGDARKDPYTMDSVRYHENSLKVFRYKWHDQKYLNNWSEVNIQNIPKQFIYYPYFEIKLPNLHHKYEVY